MDRPNRGSDHGSVSRSERANQESWGLRLGGVVRGSTYRWGIWRLAMGARALVGSVTEPNAEAMGSHCWCSREVFLEIGLWGNERSFDCAQDDGGSWPMRTHPACFSGPRTPDSKLRPQISCPKPGPLPFPENQQTVNHEERQRAGGDHPGDRVVAGAGEKIASEPGKR